MYFPVFLFYLNFSSFSFAKKNYCLYLIWKQKLRKIQPKLKKRIFSSFFLFIAIRKELLTETILKKRSSEIQAREEKARLYLERRKTKKQKKKPSILDPDIFVEEYKMKQRAHANLKRRVALNSLFFL